MSLEQFPVSRAKAILQHLNCVIMWEHHSWIHKWFHLQNSSDHESNMSFEDSSEESLMRLKLCTDFHELMFNISSQRWSCYPYYMTLTFISFKLCCGPLFGPWEPIRLLTECLYCFAETCILDEKLHILIESYKYMHENAYHMHTCFYVVYDGR